MCIIDSMTLVGAGDIGGELVEVILRLSLGLFDRTLLLSSSRQERKCCERDGGETHVDVVDGEGIRVRRAYDPTGRLAMEQVVL